MHLQHYFTPVVTKLAAEQSHLITAGDCNIDLKKLKEVFFICLHMYIKLHSHICNNSKVSRLLVIYWRKSLCRTWICPQWYIITYLLSLLYNVINFMYAKILKPTFLLCFVIQTVSSKTQACYFITLYEYNCHFFGWIPY